MAALSGELDKLNICLPEEERRTFLPDLTRTFVSVKSHLLWPLSSELLVVCGDGDVLPSTLSALSSQFCFLSRQLL